MSETPVPGVGGVGGVGGGVGPGVVTGPGGGAGFNPPPDPPELPELPEQSGTVLSTKGVPFRLPEVCPLL